jgi:hypothetical protein
VRVNGGVQRFDASREKELAIAKSAQLHASWYRLNMPELPDIAAYISALEARIVGEHLEHVRVASPFLLRTVQPPLASVEGRKVLKLRRIGKRIAIGLENDL